MTAGILSCLSVSTLYAQSTITLSGQAQIAAIPSSLLPGVFESNTEAPVYLESSNLFLSQNLAVDATLPGSYNLASQLTPGVIAAGTRVSDVMLQTNPVTKTGTEYIGSVTFSSDILGVIVESSTLNASDAVFGVSGVAYPGTDVWRGLELTNKGEDEFSISQNMQTLSFDIHTGTNIDEIRIITAGSVSNVSESDYMTSTPEPGSASLLVLGFAAILGGGFKAAGRRSVRA